MKKRRKILVAGATGALAMSLVFGSPGIKRVEASSNAQVWSITNPSQNQSSNLVIKNSKQDKRKTLMARKIPMPRAWNRR